MKRLTVTFGLAAIGAIFLLVGTALLVLEYFESEEGEVEVAPSVARTVTSPPPESNEEEAVEASLKETPIPQKQNAGMASNARTDEIDGFDEAAWQAVANELAHKDPRILMAKAMLGAGEYDDALAMLEEIIAAEPGTDVAALAHLMKGIALWGKGDGEAALAEYQKIMLEYPESAAAIEAVDRFSTCHFKMGSVLEGMDWVMGVLEADPANVAARKAKWELVKRASRGADVSDLEELWEICMDGLARRTETLEGYEAGLALARALRRVNRSKMDELLQEIAENCPDPTIAGQAKVELSKERHLWGNSKEAVRLAEEVLASLADEAVKKQARRDLVKAYMGEGDIQMAREVFSQVMLDGWTTQELCSSLEFAAATALDQRLVNHGLLQWFADLSATEGPVGEYAFVLKSLLENPQDPEALEAAPFDTVRWLGRAYARQGEYDTVTQMGMECLQKAENEYGGDLEKYLQAVDLIASAMAGRGNYTDAADMLVVGLDRFHDNPSTAVWALQRAYYLERDGRYDDAIAEYERVANDFPDSVETPRALYSLGYVYESKVPSPAKAREAYQRLIDNYPDSTYAGYARSRLEPPGGQ